LLASCILVSYRPCQVKRPGPSQGSGKQCDGQGVSATTL
jgi:hypothetical protein